MRLNIIDEDTFYVHFCDNTDVRLLSKDDLSEYIKKIILRLKSVYNITLRGFYEIIIYPNSINNIFKFTNIDGYTSKTIDLRIIISDEEKVYLRTEDFYLVKDFDEIFIDDNFYYIDSNQVDLSKNLHFCEFFDIILSNELDFMGLRRIVINNEKGIRKNSFSEKHQN